MPTPDISIPTSYSITVPTTYTVNTPDLEEIRIKELPVINVNAGLDNIRIKEVPKIEVDTNSTLNSDSRVALSSDNNIRIKEIPEIRAHVPMNFNFGVKFFGLEFLVYSLCGELQLITEKYIPNTWERCEDPADNS